jgi:hypothetical protein
LFINVAKGVLNKIIVKDEESIEGSIKLSLNKRDLKQKNRSCC